MREVFSTSDFIFRQIVYEGGINTFPHVQGLKYFTSQKGTWRYASSENVKKKKEQTWKAGNSRFNTKVR